MLKDILTSDLVVLDAEGFKTPEEVIRFAGGLLEKAGRVLPTYTEKMVQAFHTLGPYIVMAPGIAMPHAAPAGDVLWPCVSFVRLCQPMTFGHPDNDPVRLVFALGGVESGGHLEVLEAISGLLGDEKKLKALYTVSSYEELVKLM